jgi:uncharacterized protein YjbI with pentapeptide repeats
VAESRQPWQVVRQGRDHWPWRVPRTAVLAVLAVLAGVGWWRWGLARLAVAAGIALVGWLIIRAVVMPGRLAPPLREPDLAGLPDTKARLEATDARIRLQHDLGNGPLQWLTVLAALAVAVAGFQQLAEDRDQASQDRQLTRQGQASERFTRAIDQLGSRRVETRIGGIYGLDQIAEQNPENTRPVGEVLLAWLNGRPRPRVPPKTRLREYAPDLQAALSVLTRHRYSSLLTRHHYTSIVPTRLDLHGLGLVEANLPGANLSGANLSHANVHAANLTSAILRDAELRDADLHLADLSHTDLRGADLWGANLNGADLSGAYLSGAYLGGADLGGADLRAADLRGATMAGATVAGTTRAILRGAKVDERTRWPDGFDWRQAGVEVAA